MKELPGAPALPEGWFYRVTSRPYGSTGKTYTLWVWMPVWFFHVPVAWTRVINRARYGTYSFYGVEERPTTKHLVDAAHKAYGTSADDTTVEGDYR